MEILLPERFDYNFRKELNQIEFTTNITLNFERVKYIDSAGLGLLLYLKSELEKKESIILIKNILNKNVYNILKMASFDKTFEIIGEN